MLDKINEAFLKFRTTIVSIAIICAIVVLSFGGYKFYKWMYPPKKDIIENTVDKEGTKVNSNKKGTQVLPPTKDLDKIIDDIISTM